MSGEIWLLFAVTETVLCFTPGPAVLLVLSQALARGTSSSVWANLGILAGNAMYFILSATSLGALLLASYEVFSLVRWVGAAYLVWLGVTTLRGRSSALAVAPVEVAAHQRRRIFLDGFVLQAANPKALVLFGAPSPVHRPPGRSGRPGRAG